MELKTWMPFPYLDKEWAFESPRLVRESFEFRPSMDVVKTDGKLVLTVELPGIAADNVDVSLDGDILTIKGEKTDERDISESDHFVHERSFGSFLRRMTMPDGVTPDEIEAGFENGVLTITVTIPEEREAEPRRIPVGTKAS